MFSETQKNILSTIILGVALMGCGGGGGGSSTGTDPGTGIVFPTRILSWAPPTAYTDNTTLNPVTDLDVFEIYVKQDSTFTPSDSAMAAVGASDPLTGQVTTSFNLASLSPFLSSGVTYHVAVRAVARNGLKSDFSQIATFSF